MKKSKTALIISGILCLIAGTLLIVTPLNGLLGIAIFLGITLLITGISEISLFIAEGKGNRSGWLLASGILSGLLGIWTAFGSGAQILATLLPIIFAVWIMFSGVTTIAGASERRREGIGSWKFLMGLGVLKTVVGFSLMFVPLLSALVITFSMAFVFYTYGISDILLAIGHKKPQ